MLRVTYGYHSYTSGESPAYAVAFYDWRKGPWTLSLAPGPDTPSWMAQFQELVENVATDASNTVVLACQGEGCTQAYFLLSNWVDDGWADEYLHWFVLFGNVLEGGLPVTPALAVLGLALNYFRGSFVVHPPYHLSGTSIFLYTPKAG